MLRCMAPLCRRLAILSHRPLRADGVSLATSNRTPDGIRLRGTDVPFESIALWLQGPLSTYRRTARLRTIDGRLGNERLANGLATPCHNRSHIAYLTYMFSVHETEQLNTVIQKYRVPYRCHRSKEHDIVLVFTTLLKNPQGWRRFRYTKKRKSFQTGILIGRTFHTFTACIEPKSEPLIRQMLIDFQII